MSTAGVARDTTSDWSLLERIEKKDEEALSALYDRYGGLVFSEAKRILHGAGEAEEILQDVFYQLWETAERFATAKGSLAGWLLLVTRNQAVARLRRHRAEEVEESGVALAIHVESRAAQNLLSDKVRAALARLSEKQREALLCAYFDGMSYAEIAKKDGLPAATVKTRMRNAMDALKKVLS